jgi:hypothetical protein
LAFSSKKAAEIMKKVLESAVANAEHNEGADVDDLKVSTVFVNEGRSLKRIMPRAKGRADRIASGPAAPRCTKCCGPSRIDGRGRRSPPDRRRAGPGGGGRPACRRD